MRRLSAFVLMSLLVVGLGVPAFAGGKDNEESYSKKVFVCKYVGTPGVDERLQTGDNPISVSINSIDNDFEGDPELLVGLTFPDAHGKSIVIAVDNGQDEPSISECPPFTPDTTIPEEETTVPTVPTTIPEEETTIPDDTTTTPTTVVDDTTTTTVAESTTTGPSTTTPGGEETSTTTPTTVDSEEPGTTETTTVTDRPEELPFTGLDAGQIATLVSVGIILLLLGALMVQRANKGD